MVMVGMASFLHANSSPACDHLLHHPKPPFGDRVNQERNGKSQYKTRTDLFLISDFWRHTPTGTARKAMTRNQAGASGSKRTGVPFLGSQAFGNLFQFPLTSPVQIDV